MSRPTASFFFLRFIASSVSIGSVRSFGPSLETPFCSCVPQTLLRPLLTSPCLSTRGSPRVRVCSFCSRLWALQNAVSDYWASRVLAGFWVGAGRATGLKEETTLASNTPNLITEPLDQRWLERARCSRSAEPLWEPVYRQAPLAPETWERLCRHPQFR